MNELPTIPLVDSAIKFNNIIYDDDETRKKGKIMGYLIQTGLINSNADKSCENGHQMSIRKSKKAIDGWWWRCSPKGCQKSQSIRIGTFFNENRLQLWHVLILIFNFAFEFLNTTVSQLVNVSAQTISGYKRRLRLIILTMFDKNNIKLGGEGKVVEIDESLFIKVKHNRGCDTLRPKVWVFGLYERATEDEPKRVLFFKVEARDAVTLLNIIYNHVLPGTTIFSDEWAAYNRIIHLDRRLNHRTVNHSVTFVAPDGTHTNSIESTWRAAKRQFKEMNGVSRLYLQAYLDEYCWRLANGNRNGWMIFSAIIKAIRDYFNHFQNANNILDQTIREENDILNVSADVQLNFGTYANEEVEPLALGNINQLIVPINVAEIQPILQATTIERSSASTPSISLSMASSSAPVQASTSRSDQNAFGGLSLINPNNESQTITPAQIQRHSTPTSVGEVDSGEPVPKRTRTQPLNETFTIGPIIQNEADFTTEYRMILEDFVLSSEEQFACPSTLTTKQRAIVHKIATDLNLKHESKGNWRKMTLFIYKNQFNRPSQRGSQATATALQNIAAPSQQINQNVRDVVNADLIELNTGLNNAQAISARVPRKRGRPPKQTTQPSTSTGIENANLNVAKTQTAIPRREGLRSQRKS